MTLCLVGDIWLETPTRLYVWLANATEHFHLQTRGKTTAESEFEVFLSSLGQNHDSSYMGEMGGNLPLLLALWQVETLPPPFYCMHVSRFNNG